MRSLVVAFLSCFVLVGANFSYEGYKVMKVVPNSSEQVKILRDLEKNGYDFWTDKYDVGLEVRVMVSPLQEEAFVQVGRKAGFNPTVAVSNVQELINNQLVKADTAASARLLSYSWDQYHTIDRIYTWLDELAAQYPNIVTPVTIGRTYEGRDIRGVVIDYRRGQRGERPLTGMIEGGIHAREWISPATVTWIIKEFLTSNDADVRNLAENFVWHIFPVVNPDGYAYTFNGTRMWRKNRNPANHVSCPNDEDVGNGIDLNRNFDFHWMSVGATLNPCNLTYAGPSAASEVETISIQNYVLQLKESADLLYYFAFHSYSQMILVPYSHLTAIQTAAITNYGDLYDIAISGAVQLIARHGTPYRVGTSLDILYAVSGSSFDWVKGVANVPIVYLFELRDLGEFGFLLPTNQIVPNNEEIMDCLVAMDRRTRTLGYYSGAASFAASILTLALGVVLTLFR